MREHSPLKLIARSGADISVLSALLQDALLAGVDMQYIAAEKTLICLLNRYCRETEKEAPQRRLCGLKIGQVEKVQTLQIALEKEQFYNLLSIEYEEAEKLLILTFSGGAAIRLFIEEITITLGDVAEAHPSLARPVHE